MSASDDPAIGRDCLHHLIEDQARRTPDLPAVACEGDTLTYRQLDQRAEVLAAMLRERGVGPDVIVGLLVERSLDAIVGILGVFKAGGAYLPIDPATPFDRVALMIEDARAQVVLTHTALRPQAANGHTLPICLDLMDWAATPAERSRDDRVRPEHLAYVIYTSGSTGKPKGVCIEHRHIVAYTRAIADRLKLEPGWRYATVSTMAADLGHTTLFPSLVTGGCLHVISSARAENPSQLAEYFAREAIDVLKIVPSHLAALQSGQQAREIMPRKRLILGGEASRLEWIERLRELAPECEIFNHYGPTETTVGVLTFHVTGSIPATTTGTLPLGGPLVHATAYVVDAEGTPVTPGAEGELWIGGESIARGYLHRRELTAERFVRDRFDGRADRRLYRTGDLVRALPNGLLEFCGRIDDQIKIRGYRVEPDEVASVLCEHADVQSAVVLARDDHAGGKQLAAYIIPERSTRSAGQTLNPVGQTFRSADLIASIRAHLKSRLPPYMIPAAFMLLEAFPRNANGKIDRRALAETSFERAAGEPSESKTLTPTESALAEIWTSVLGVDSVNANDSFFDLGGHSLMAMRMMSRIRDTFGIEVPLRALFEGSTLAGLARIVDGLTWLAVTKNLTPPGVRGEEEIAL